MKFRANNGFTLSEVLITLGIIGIVAAMTIPNLMQKYYEKQTVTRLKETYSILTQAIKTCGEEEGYPEEWGITGRNAQSTNIVAQKLLPYFKVSVDCGLRMEKNDSCFPDTIKPLNNSYTSDLKNGTRYFVSLINGSSVAIESAETEFDIYMYFLVDTNGKAKPNVWGKDIFEFSYRPSLGLVPSGHPLIGNSYKKNCRHPNDIGYGCAY